MSIRRDRSSKRQPAWVLDYIDENRIRRRIRVRCTRSVAETKYGLILNEIEKKKMGLSNGSQFLELCDLVKSYLEQSEMNGHSPLTIKRVRNATDAFSRIVGPNTPITEITPPTIEDFKRKRLLETTRRGTKVSKGGLNADLKHLKAVFNWAVKKSLLARSPFLGVDFVKSPGKPVRFLTSREIKALYEAINLARDQDARDLVTAYLQLGARKSELLPPKFEWENVRDGHVVLVGKRNKRRTLPVSGLLKEILKSRELYDHPFAFSPDQVSRMILKYYSQAGIDKANVHTLRKTCGALLIQNGVDIYRVSKWLGHSTVTVTEKHYVDLLSSDYDDISLIMGHSLSEIVPKDPDFSIQKVLPNVCQNGDKLRIFQTN